MGAVEETGKVASSLIDSLKGLPVMIGFLVMVAGFLVFLAYQSGKNNEREQRTFDLIQKLVTDIRDCRGGEHPTPLK